MDSAGIPPNRPTRHELKAWPKPFASILSSFKKHEIRLNDRDFREGDDSTFGSGTPLRRPAAADRTPATTVIRYWSQGIGDGLARSRQNRGRKAA
jgi:hypothetical protein